MAINQGSKLEFLRNSDRRTNEELALLWGVSIATMYNYYDKEEIPSKKLRRICEKMKWDYKQFVESDGNEELKKENEGLKRENILLSKQVGQLERMVEMLETGKKRSK